MARRSPSSDDAIALRAAVQEFVRRFGLLDEDATPCGQPLGTSHAHALMLLGTAGDAGMHQAELGRRLGIDKSNASRLVQKLAKKGHAVIRAAPDEDARIKRVRLTAKGARLAAEVDAASRQRFADVYAALQPRHRRAVLDGLAHLTRALQRKRP